MGTRRMVADHMACPHCGTTLTILIVLRQDTCPSCRKEFLLKDDIPRMPLQDSEERQRELVRQAGQT
jgi:uncharacterized protein YbaR (Trm112 family)